MSAKLKMLERQFGRQNPERIPAPEGLGVAIENMIADRVREELAKQPVKTPVQVQRIVERPKPSTLDPAVERGLNQAVRDQVAIALREQQERLAMQLDRQQQALDMQLDMQRQQFAQQHAQQLDLQRQFNAPALTDPKQLPPVQKRTVPLHAVFERDGAGLVRAAVVNGQRLLAQRDGAGKLIGIVSEDA